MGTEYGRKRGGGQGLLWNRENCAMYPTIVLSVFKNRQPVSHRGERVLVLADRFEVGSTIADRKIMATMVFQ